MNTDDTNTETNATNSAPASKPKRKASAKKPAKKAAKKKTVKKAKKSGGGAGRAAKYADTARITLLVKENPRREGTEAHARFKCLMGCKTVGEFIKKAKPDWDARGTLLASVKRKQIKIAA